jgi:thymidylate synthase ThyX
LPNALKAEIVVTGFMDDWKHLFNLRVKGTTGAPHPQMLEVMKPVYDEFVKRYGIA